MVQRAWGCGTGLSHVTTMTIIIIVRHYQAYICFMALYWISCWRRQYLLIMIQTVSLLGVQVHCENGDAVAQGQASVFSAGITGPEVRVLQSHLMPRGC